jgi:hypothetical protein
MGLENAGPQHIQNFSTKFVFQKWTYTPKEYKWMLQGDT